MTVFGDEVGLAWADSHASARDFVRGFADVSQHNPLRVAIDEDMAELQRVKRRRASLEAQLAEIDADEARLLDRLEAKLEAAVKFEQTGEIDPRLQPECRTAIQAELAADSRALLQAADMQAVPELRGMAKELGWDFDSARADNDFVYVTVKRKREQIANAGPRPTRESLRRSIAHAISGFCPQLRDRSKIVSDAREMIARVLTPMQPAAP